MTGHIRSNSAPEINNLNNVNLDKNGLIKANLVKHEQAPFKSKDDSSLKQQPYNKASASNQELNNDKNEIFQKNICNKQNLEQIEQMNSNGAINDNFPK